MEHYYQDIHGWTSFYDFYSEMVKRFPPGSHFVEVGSWLGRSAIYLGVEIVNSGKEIKLDCVDAWAIPEDSVLIQEQAVIQGTLYKDFLRNIEPLRKIIKPIRCDSAEGASFYDDESLDFVYLDADHNYEPFKRELHAWYPKIKKGGVFAGHDADFIPVKQGLDNFFPNQDYEVRSCQSWVHYKK